MAARIPLNAAASDNPNNRQTTSSLPPEVVQCLENARFLHLATCTDNIPTVSLMNYTYLPAGTSPYTPHPAIIMTTNPASKKMANLRSNPHVSLLVHDWVSHRPPARHRRASSSQHHHHQSPTRSGLASLLLNLNTAAVSSISATINGDALLVAPGSPDEAFYRRAHLDNNTFDDGPSGFNPFGQIAPAAQEEDGGRECFVAGEEVRVIVVAIRDVRISDWQGNVKDWVLVPATEEPRVNGAG